MFHEIAWRCMSQVQQLLQFIFFVTGTSEIRQILLFVQNYCVQYP